MTRELQASAPDLRSIAPAVPTIFGFGAALDPTWPLWCAGWDLEHHRVPWEVLGEAQPPPYWSVDYAGSSAQLADKLLSGRHQLHLHAGAHAPRPCCPHYRPIWLRRWRISHLTLRIPQATRFPRSIREPLREASRVSAQEHGHQPPAVDWDVAHIELHAFFGERREGREARIHFAYSPFEGSLFARHVLASGHWPLAGVVTVRQRFGSLPGYGAALCGRRFGSSLLRLAPTVEGPLLLVGDPDVQDYPGRVAPTELDLPGWGYQGAQVYRWAKHGRGQEAGRHESSMHSRDAHSRSCCPPSQ